MGQPVIHFEIGCKDKAKVEEFYSKAFGWEISQRGPAGMIDTGAGEGVQGHFTSLGHEPHNFINIYIRVDSLEEYIKKIESLGGKTVIPPTIIPNANMGSFAWVADPEGNVVGLWKN